MDIYFVRHGAAVEQQEWKGSDRERPLTDAGARQMTRAAEGLAALGVHPDRIISSPLVRARQTADILAKELRLTERPVADDRLAPGFGIEGLTAILETYSGSGSLVLVGHEPDFSTVIGRLIGGGRVECKKGSLARVQLKDAKGLTGVLLWLLPPKLLGGIARDDRLPREAE